MYHYRQANHYVVMYKLRKEFKNETNKYDFNE